MHQPGMDRADLDIPKHVRYSTFASWSTVKVTSVQPEILGQGGEVVVGAAGSALLRAPVFEQRRRQDRRCRPTGRYRMRPASRSSSRADARHSAAQRPAGWSAPHARGPRSRLGLPPCSPVPPGSRPVQRRANVPTPRFPPRGFRTCRHPQSTHSNAPCERQVVSKAWLCPNEDRWSSTSTTGIRPA